MALDRIGYLGHGKLDEQSLRWAWDSYFLHKGVNEFRQTESNRG